MILKTYPNINLYGKYFLAMEAPNDEVVNEEQPKPKRNVKVVSVKPSNRGKDFTQIGNPAITSDTTEVGDDLDLDNNDYNAETPEQLEDDPKSVEEPTQTEDTSENNEMNPTAEDTDTTPTEEDPPDIGENDDTDFTGNTDETPDTGTEETGEDGPVVDGDDDFADGAEDQPTDDNTSSNNTNTTDGNKLTPPGVELDSTRKYNLYKEYMSLYNSCDNYISKLENILKNDFEENQIIKISVNNLREIKDIIFDYMTIRFPLNTYVQSLLFYQKMVVAVQLVFNLLKSIKNNEKK